jgi:hypothetical protein
MKYAKKGNNSNKIAFNQIFNYKATKQIFYFFVQRSHANLQLIAIVLTKVCLCTRAHMRSHY